MARRSALIFAPFLILAVLTPAWANTYKPDWARQSYQSDPTDTTVVRFAAIGDWGSGDSDAWEVHLLVESWAPDFIITLGDNNYPDGEASTIDNNIGRLYHEYIQPYSGSFGPGATTNRFFPTLGNHDWHTPNAQPYFDYFELPGNERYYDFTWGPVHLFALDSDPNEPDGRDSDSIQGNWLQTQLATSTSPWKIIYFHHAPYSSSDHGSSGRLRWPFEEWGASAVLAGHDHTYERVIIDGFPYFTNGVGGASRYSFGDPIPGSMARYNASPGAMLITADETRITFEFYSISDYNNPVDTFVLFMDTLGVNDPPLPNNDSASTNNDTEVLIDVAGNDTDFEDNLNPAATTITSMPANGTATSNGDGTIVYVPDAGFIGSDNFTYEIADSEGLTGTAIVSVTVTSPYVLTFTPTDDATIRADDPEENEGGSDTLEVDQDTLKNILLRFDVSGVATQPIASAILRLHVVDSSTTGGTFFVTSDTTWSEDTVTWETAPQAEGDPFGELFEVESDNSYELDVTRLITGDGPVSIRISSEDTNGADYASKENTSDLGPELIITLQE